MQKSVSLRDTLKANNYYLLTTEEEKEVYDDDGNLILYQAEGGSCVSVPNTEEVRRLYDLPSEMPKKKVTIKMDELTKPGSLMSIPYMTERVVWAGQRTLHSTNATKMLIKLFDSPKYKTLMKNPLTVKLKVWEKIANELESKGFKIAANSRDAGLRTFQKWRNMERTYWKFLKLKPDECGEERRRRKPYFFDDLHVVLSKREKESTQEPNSVNNSEGISSKQEEDDDFGVDYEEEVDVRPEDELARRKRISDGYDDNDEAFPRQALTLLASLVTSPKYDECLKDNFQKPFFNKNKVWENIYMDMMEEGWNFGSSIREGALILSAKWHMVEKTILRKKLCGPRTLYTPTFRKAMLIEIERRKVLGSNFSSDLQSSLEVSNPSNRRPKNGEIDPEAIEALLKVVGSEHYQYLLATSGGKRAKIWEKIFDEVQSQGFEIAGATKREKVTRLFQKWRNMKKAFVKYHIAKFKGRDIKKPLFYELMFNIISKDVLSMSSSDCDSDEEVRMNEWDEELESEYSPDLMEFTQSDHDYGPPNGTSYSVEVNASELLSSFDTEHRQSVGAAETVKNTGTPPLPQPRPSTSRTSRSHEVLKQIKSLHETSLAMQQQNFSKIISLLENQIKEQNRLTSVISEYFTRQTIKSNSKNRLGTEHAGHNEKRSRTLKDETYLG